MPLVLAVQQVLEGPDRLRRGEIDDRAVGGAERGIPASGVGSRPLGDGVQRTADELADRCPLLPCAGLSGAEEQSVWGWFSSVHERSHEVCKQSREAGEVVSDVFRRRTDHPSSEDIIPDHVHAVKYRRCNVS